MITPPLTIPGASLRPWASTDADVLVQAWNDSDISAWNPVPPEPTVATATSWIGGVAARAAARLAFDWVIDPETAHDATRSVVGEVGLSGFSPKHDGALIGYWLLPEARGHGLASSAVRAVSAWAHMALGLQVIVARCHVANLASQRVAERAGFVLGGVDTHDHQLWRSRQ